MIFQKIDTIRYPFYNNTFKASDDDIQQLHSIATNAYVQTDEAKELFSLDTLTKLYHTSPSSWILAKIGSDLLGYAHVETIRESTFLELKNGLIDENDFRDDDTCKINLCEQPSLVHIGSIVVKRNTSMGHTNTVIFLLASLLDKIVKDMVDYQTTQIFAVEYEDANGKSHFKHKLHRYGFSLVGRTKTNNGVFFIDIQQEETYFSSLLYHIAKKQKKYYAENKKYIKRLKKIFPEI